MATIDLGNFPVQLNPTEQGNARQPFSRYGRGNFLIWDLGLPWNADQVAEASQPIYRGRLGSIYVYRTGSPPVGATEVVIVGFTTV
jgi:hypothetical protein